MITLTRVGLTRRRAKAHKTHKKLRKKKEGRMENSSTKKKSVEHGQVMDGSDIMELVGNEEVFSNFVDHKFQELDRDRDGKLSVKELKPAVADIGAALGLPAQGSSADSDHIYSEVSLSFQFSSSSQSSPLFIFPIP